MRFATAVPDEVLVKAAERNQREWLARLAKAAGGTVRREAGATWMVSPRGASIAFPQLRAPEAELRLDAIVDGAVRGGAPGIACWSSWPARPRDLGERLVARGFEWGWQPCWMTVRLDAIRDVPTPQGIAIEEVASLADAHAAGLPYHDPADTTAAALTTRRPRRIWHLAAFRGPRAVGHAVLSVTTGRSGVAGLYDVGVAPGERRRGVGTALTSVAARIARDLGCEHATLNATPDGERLYRALGFRVIGTGQTWWMHAPAVEAWRRRMESR